MSNANKKYVEQKENYRIIRKGDAKSQTNISCSLCECVIIDEIDEISILRSTCCFDCENEIVDVNRKKWLEGWRPEPDLIKKIMSERLKMPHAR